MDEKRCEWCGTLSPADAEKCTLCRIPFSAPVPPPQDWSHLTGNIPVITAPLLETPASAPAAAPAPDDPTPAAVVPQQVQREPLVATPALQQVPGTGVESAAVPAPVTAGFAAPVAPVANEVVPTVGEMATDPARAEGQSAEALPGWRTPDDPTLRVFADRLQERERRAGNPSAARRARRRRRRLARLLVWLVALGLVAAVIILAPDRLPSF